MTTWRFDSDEVSGGAVSALRYPGDFSDWTIDPAGLENSDSESPKSPWDQGYTPTAITRHPWD